jgi:hypothetical protein
MFGRKNRKQPLKREPITDLEDLRDDCIALYRNSGLSFSQVHANGGPTPQTVSKWLYKETHFPRLDTMRALTKAVGGEMIIVGSKTAQQILGRSQTGRLNLPMPVAPEMDLVAHRARQKKRRAVYRNRSAHRKSVNG